HEGERGNRRTGNHGDQPNPFSGCPKVPGHDGDAAVPDHLGQRHGHSRRFVVRRRSSRFHISALHPGFHRLFASAGYHDGIGEERDVWHHHHRRRFSGGALNCRRGGAGRPVHHPSCCQVHLSGCRGGFIFYGHVLFRR